MPKISSTPHFGWRLPTGSQRMPHRNNSYRDHVRQILDLISGHFHSTWIPDHLMDGGRAIPEAMVTLSFFGRQYEELFMGTAVVGQSYRNPALLAKMSATLQQLTAGRFILGVGAGWKGDENRAYGYEFPNASVRIAQLAETIQICKLLWDPSLPEATFRGRHYQIENAICRSKPTPPPPLMNGGGGEQLTLRVVAQFADWWNLPGATPKVYAHKAEILAWCCAEINRPPDSIRKTWMGAASLATTRAQAERQMEGYPIWPGDIPLLGTPANIREQLQAYLDLGVDLFILSFVDEPERIGINLFLEKVLLYLA